VAVVAPGRRAKAIIAAALTTFGALAAFGGSAWFAGRFFAAQRRILVASKRSDCQGVGKGDERSLNLVYFAHAAEELAPTLHAVELRAYRLQRMARAVPLTDPRQKRWNEEADRLLEFVHNALRKAALVILENRSSNAFSGKPTFASLAFAIVGIVLVFGVADYAKGQRDLIELRTKCQEAVGKGATDACDPVRSKEGIDAATRAAASKKKKTDDALAALREDLPRGARGRLQRLEACTALLSTHDALSGSGDQTQSAVVQVCQALVTGR